MRMNTSILRTLFVSLALALLVACSSAPDQRGAPPTETASAQSSRYSIEQDRAPTTPLDPSRIRPVVPVPERRTIAGNFSPYTINGRTYHVMSSEIGYDEIGYASWYGEKFHGHHTSNGEVYDMYQVSAAHTALPIPSYAEVINLENGKRLTVRINDRGPFHDERIIDLSYAAAYLLGFADQGTARVRVTAVVPDGGRSLAGASAASPQAVASSGGQYLQVAAFASRQAAELTLQRVRSLTGQTAHIRSLDGGDSALHRVRVGPIADPDEVVRIKALIAASDLGQPYVVTE
jgi:rare lipoprotein A